MKTDSLDDWRKTTNTSDVTSESDGKEVTLFGWIKEIRDLGAVKFLILQDREGTIQLTIAKDKAEEKVLRKTDLIQTQYCVAVKGTVKKTSMTKRGFEVIPKEIKILGVAQHPLPLDVTGKTSSLLDTRLNARVLDLCHEENRALWSVQSKALEALRQFLTDRGFIEVYTPRIISTATEGGAALFSMNYFDQEAYLAQSP